MVNLNVMHLLVGSMHALLERNCISDVIGNIVCLLHHLYYLSLSCLNKGSIMVKIDEEGQENTLPWTIIIIIKKY